MFTFRHLFRVMPLAAVVLLAVGCGQATTAPASVHGKVSFRGWPVAGARVIFVPDAQLGGSGPLLQAETGPDGTYLLRGEDTTGVAPGRYRITVMGLDTGAAQAPLPEKYRDPDLSGLSADVQAGADNNVDLSLE